MNATQRPHELIEDAAMSNPADIDEAQAKAEQSAEADAPEGSDKADQILDAIDLLLDLIDEENEALEAHDDKTVIALQDRKEKLSRLYEGHMRAVAQNPSLLNGITEEQRDDLKEAAAELREAAEDNRRLLHAEMEANNRLLRAIVNAVKDKHQETAVYARSGDMEDGITASTDNALAFNKET